MNMSIAIPYQNVEAPKIFCKLMVPYVFNVRIGTTITIERLNELKVIIYSLGWVTGRTSVARMYGEI